jgi:hypothetical protein
MHIQIEKNTTRDVKSADADRHHEENGPACPVKGKSPAWPQGKTSKTLPVTKRVYTDERATRTRSDYRRHNEHRCTQDSDSRYRGMAIRILALCYMLPQSLHAGAMRHHGAAAALDLAIAGMLHQKQALSLLFLHPFCSLTNFPREFL